jgi:hypothetical protein
MEQLHKLVQAQGQDAWTLLLERPGALDKFWRDVEEHQHTTDNATVPAA